MSDYVPQNVPAARLMSAAAITAAAIQAGKIDAGKTAAVVGYFNLIYNGLFDRMPQDE